MKQHMITTGVAGLMILQLTIGWVLISNQSIRLDESQSLWMAAKSTGEMLKVTGQDVHVPFYNLLVHGIVKAGDISIENVRMLSLLLLVLSTPIMYMLGNLVGGKKVGIIATSFLALSPFISWYGAEARMYSLFLFLTILNSFFSLKLFKSDGSQGKLGYVLSLIAGLFSHYFFGLVVLTQMIYVFVKGRTRLTLMSLVSFSGIFLLPWLWYVFSLGGASNTRPMIERPSSFNIVLAFVNFLFGFHDSGTQGNLVSLWPLSLIILLTIFTRKSGMKVRSLGYFMLMGVIPITVAYGLSFFRPVFLARYFIFIVPSLYIILAWVIANQSKRAIVTIMFLLMTINGGLLVKQTLAVTNPVREDYEVVTKRLNTEVEANEVIVISPPFTIYPIEINYKGKARLETAPQWNRYVSGPIPEFSIENFIKQMEGYREVYQNVILVTSYNQGYQNEIVDYMDKNYLRLDAVKIGSQIEIRKYKLRY